MSLSQTNVGPSGPELRGSNITLESVLSKTDPSIRQTKIVCTLGPVRVMDGWTDEESKNRQQHG